MNWLMNWRLNWPVALGLVLILGGGALASWVQTDAGRIKIRDLRFLGATGNVMSGLLYVPANVNAARPAPGVLAVHGYINTRETQDGFAIELARRGIVVLAIDQTGHGYSAPPAFAQGFGGPDGLTYLRSLDFVDKQRIGLEGHSMGGWAVLSAAAAQPESYAAMALVGSSTGIFGTREGTADFPRNLAAVFSRWDEFAPLMWSANTALDLPRTPKFMRLFATDHGVVPNRMYGDPRKGTARVYYAPVTTHPGEHWSDEAIGDTVGWLTARLHAPTQLKVDDQIWRWKETGTLLALIGAAMVLVNLPLRMLHTTWFRGLAGESAAASAGMPTMLLSAIVPVVTYFFLFKLADQKMPLSASFPQQITNGLLLWLVGNGLVVMTTVLVDYLRGRHLGLAWPTRNLWRTAQAALLAAVTVAAFLLLLWLSDVLFKTDFRIWVVAMKLPAPWHWRMIVSYAPALLAFFVLSHAATSALIDSRQWFIDAWLRLLLAYCGGFILLLAIQYGGLLLDRPLPLGEPLLTIVAIQFVVLLAIVAAVQAAAYRATGTVWLGAALNGLWVTIVVVAGQATQFGGPVLG